MNTMKWYNIMDKTGVKAIDMFCEDESIRTRLVSNLADFAWDMWNAAATIERVKEYRDYLEKNA